MGHGIVGGSLKSQLPEPTLLALACGCCGEIGRRYPAATHGFERRPGRLAPAATLGICEARVPPGTLVLFREPTAWDRYKAYIVGAVIALVLAQIVLIAGLLVQRARRRRAEAECAQRQQPRARELRTNPRSWRTAVDRAGRGTGPPRTGTARRHLSATWTSRVRISSCS